MYSLTERQAKLLAYIKDEIGAGRPAPSIRQMQAYMGASSTSRIHALVKAIEERGHIKVIPERARAIKLLEQK